MHASCAECLPRTSPVVKRSRGNDAIVPCFVKASTIDLIKDNVITPPLAAPRRNQLIHGLPQSGEITLDCVPDQRQVDAELPGV